MMLGIGVPAWLACGYAVMLLLCAYGIDALARRASRSSRLTQTQGFTYHEDHDAWLCPQDQWLWPTSFDPENRVMRYRASPSICNACPVKDTCTYSSAGREIVRAVDAWPASEAARFHRGIACAVVVMGIIWPLGLTFTAPVGPELALLLVTAALIAIGGWPLFRHLRRSPHRFPVGVDIATLDENLADKAADAAAELRRHAHYGSDSLATPGGEAR